MDQRQEAIFFCSLLLVHQCSVLYSNLKVLPQAASCDCCLNRWEKGNLFLLQASPNIWEGLWQLRTLLITPLIQLQAGTHTHTNTSKNCQISFLSFSKSSRSVWLFGFQIDKFRLKITLLTYIQYIEIHDLKKGALV